MRRFRRGFRARGQSTLLVKATGIFIVMTIAILLMDSLIRPIIQTMSSYQAKVFATQAINDAISTELDNLDISYDELVTVSVNSKDEVTSIQTNMLALNRLRSNITEAILQELGSIENQIIDVPIGTLSGVQFLSGRGNNIQFRIVPAGYIQTDFENKFDSAGINQTRHQIVLNVDMTVIAIIPGYSVTTEVKANYCLAETVIVGTVPDNFTKVTGDDRSLTSKLFDYKGE